MFTKPHPLSARRTLGLALPAFLVAAIALTLILPGSANTHALHRSESGKSAAQRMILTVDPTHPGIKFAPGTIGLSIEADELGTHDLSATHKSLVALMRLLGPGVLRLGGNSVDYSWWTSDGEASPAWAKSMITPSDLVTLNSLLAATDWRAILGVNLSRFDPARAAREARTAERILGSRLLGLEIGNEPNAYGNGYLRPKSYAASDYLEDIAAYGAAIRSTAPKVRLYGPDLSSQAWLPTIASNKDMPFVELTQHYYPTSYSVSKGTCKGTPEPTALELLSPQVRDRENATLQTLGSSGEIAHRKTRISETNTTGSCDTFGGPATSPVFASALWSFDWILRAANVGVAGLNFHGYFGRCEPNAVSPICAPGDAAEARGQVTARPEFYGLLAARQLEGGHFIPVQIYGQRAGDDLSTYATTHFGGRITLAIYNFSTGRSTPLFLKVPGYKRATSERLIAPSLSATSGVTFGDSSLNTSGTPRITGVTVPRVDGAFQLKLAPASATVITLGR